MTSTYNPHEAAAERKARRARLWAHRGIVDPWVSREVPAPTVTKITVENLQTKAEAIVREIAVEPPPPVAVGHFIPAQTILRAVAKFYGISTHDIMSHWRGKKVVRPRMVTAFLMRHAANYPMTKIGKALHRDHSTVIYSIHKISLLAKTDTRLAEDIRLLTAWLTGRNA